MNLTVQHTDKHIRDVNRREITTHCFGTESTRCQTKEIKANLRINRPYKNNLRYAKFSKRKRKSQKRHFNQQKEVQINADEIVE